MNNINSVSEQVNIENYIAPDPLTRVTRKLNSDGRYSHRHVVLEPLKGVDPLMIQNEYCRDATGVVCPALVKGLCKGMLVDVIRYQYAKPYLKPNTLNDEQLPKYSVGHFDQAEVPGLWPELSGVRTVSGTSDSFMLCNPEVNGKPMYLISEP